MTYFIKQINTKCTEVSSMKHKVSTIVLIAVFLTQCLCLLAIAVTYRSALTAPEKPMPVLMYHNIVPEGEPCEGMTVTVDKLEKDLEYLAENDYITVLPRNIAAGYIPEKPVMLTFDDGYLSSYELLFPLLKKYNMCAVVSVVGFMPDIPSANFCTWEMLREMSDSGLVEIASHTYSLHNTDERAGEYSPSEPNGIERLPGESNAGHRQRVLSDLERSISVITVNTGAMPSCFAYPYGATDEDLKDYIDNLFPVTLTTERAVASYGGGLHDLPRITVTMETELAKVLHYVKARKA